MFDIVGILILIGVGAAFGFLTIRAWKLKNTFLKWVGGILSGLLTIISVALLVLAFIGFGKLNQHYDNPVSEIQVASSPAKIARGEQLAKICMSCHTTDTQLPLSGTNFQAKFDSTFLGTFYAPNLTPSGNIKDWTDGEIIRAIREGVDDTGRSLLIMPAGDFRYMSDEDVQALVAYLRSQPATGEPMPETQFSVIGAIFMNLSDFRTVQQPTGVVTAPQAGTPEYGKYLVDIHGCADCHGAQLQGKPDTGQPGPPPGPNLTQIVPQWTEEQFMNFFNTGTLPDGKKVPMVTMKSGYSEPKMPWTLVRASTTDAELRDMYYYLHSLPTAVSSTR